MNNDALIHRIVTYLTQNRTTLDKPADVIIGCLLAQFPTATPDEIGSALNVWNLTAEVEVRRGLRECEPKGRA